LSVVLVTSHVVMKRQVRCHGRVVYPAVCLVYSPVGQLWFYMVYPEQRAATVMGPGAHTIEMFSIACCVLCWLTLQVRRNVDNLTEDDDLSNRW